MLRNDSTLFDSLPFADAIPYHAMVVHLPMASFLAQRTPRPPRRHADGGASDGAPDGADGNVLAMLGRISDAEVAQKQALLRRYAPMLHFPYPRFRQRAADSTVTGGTVAATVRTPNAVELLLERLAADAAPAAHGAAGFLGGPHNACPTMLPPSGPAALSEEKP